MAGKKKSKKRRKHNPSSEFLLPQPSDEGVEKLRVLYAERTGKEISFGDAQDVLSRIVRWQYLNYIVNTEAELRERGESGDADAAGLEPEHEQIPGEPGAAEADARGEVLAGRARGTAAARVLLEPG